MNRAEAMLRRKWGPGARCVGLLLLAVGWVGSAAMLLATQAGAQTARPQRIVSLDLCVDHLLIDLVPRARIAALTHLAANPSVSAIAERLRGLSLTRGEGEDVLRHDPDLVLAGPYGVSPTVSLLRRLDRNVVMVPLAADLDGVRTAVRQVAGAVGEEARGEAMVRAFDARLAAISAPAERARQRASALIYQVGGSASGAGTLAHSVLEAAGYRNASADYVLTRAGQVPLEALVAQPPDLLVLASPPFEYRTVIADNLRHPALQRLTRRGRSVELPWRMWLCGTPHIAEAIETLAAVHP